MLPIPPPKDRTFSSSIPLELRQSILTKRQQVMEENLKKLMDEMRQSFFIVSQRTAHTPPTQKLFFIGGFSDKIESIFKWENKLFEYTNSVPFFEKNREYQKIRFFLDVTIDEIQCSPKHFD